MNILTDLSINELRELRSHIKKNDAGHTEDQVKQLCNELTNSICDRERMDIVKPFAVDYVKTFEEQAKIKAKHLMELAEMEDKLWTYVDQNCGNYNIHVMSGEVIITVDLLGEEVFETSYSCKYLALSSALEHYSIGE